MKIIDDKMTFILIYFFFLSHWVLFVYLIGVFESNGIFVCLFTYTFSCIRSYSYIPISIIITLQSIMLLLFVH